MTNGNLSLGRLRICLKTEAIGTNRAWMTENLSVCPEDLAAIGITEGFLQNEDGMFYTQDVAKKLCGDGWQLPAYNDWFDLMEAVEEKGHSLVRTVFSKKESVFDGIPFGFYENGEWISGDDLCLLGSESGKDGKCSYFEVSSKDGMYVPQNPYDTFCNAKAMFPVRLVRPKF